MIYFKLFLLFVIISSCSSGPVTDVCSIKIHWNDPIYQVLKNDEPVNNRFYLKEDAIAVAKTLEKERECNYRK